ncbi:TetR/AcrR family transcriptional regulator [Calidifontibacter sp. DB0510]|uniref:TetR/AcrR family transcriptional regulator n=1 Tax=Metallococcus carri TaxID=1656884 RepID=A0A967EGA1_9MICO|nr:helix-turn-helix domain-containing protein [Metallococcus carri]NHN54813.1 TetR/AcrR family transcriptional regulator [Metallococcus carri]NOP37158.1 TetR/AcrR family transcriptional regulator [Calidifontibacter sp. DB2511S]
MARPAKFSDELILDGAASAIEQHGAAATIAQVSAVVGAPVGSIYHRYPSREHLLATLWLRSIRRFHAGLLATADIADPREALLAQAVHIPRFCRSHPTDALVMSLYSQRELVATGPESLREEVSGVNDEIWALGRRQTRVLFGTSAARVSQVVAMAIRQTPYGMVRPFVRSQQPLPRWLDDAARAAAGAVLDLAPTR